MVFVGIGGPLVMPPTMAVLLDQAPEHSAGTASAIFNTSRQIGGALAIAVFGALLTNHDTFIVGLRASLLIAAVVATVTITVALMLRTRRN